MSKCILIGGGDSVNEGRALDLWTKIKGEDIYSVNYAFLAMPYLPQHEVWVDTGFFKNNLQRIEDLHKAGVECVTKANARYNGISGIKQEQVNKTGKSTDGGLYTGTMGLSGTFALSLAVQREYDTIYILGYDYGTNSLNNTNTHFYQDDKVNYISHGVRNPKIYLERTNNVKASVNNYDYFKQFPCKIYNVSLRSNIATFEKIDYPTFFEKIKA